MKRRGWLACLLALGLTPPVLAQPESERRGLDARARAAQDPAELAILQRERRLRLDYGLWINHRWSDFHDDDNDAAQKDSTNATDAIDPRLWLRLTLRPPLDGSAQREHSLYLRIKDKAIWRDPADVNGGFDHNGPHLDYLFLSADLRPFWIQAGRRLYGVGQGIAYSDLGDGIELLASSSVWSLMGFASRSLPHQENLDLSVPDGKHSGRTFWGIEGRYLGIRNNGLYAYAVFQRDDAHEQPADDRQDYNYDSQYVGLGVEGKTLASLRHVAEVILETGRGRTSGANQKADVRAWAVDVSLTYDVQLPLQPTVYGEYAIGSGDADRRNVTDTIGGNTAGRDTNFLYFGYLPTGYALAPRLSNLQMLKGGLALKPLSWLAFFQELTCSADLYWYWKEDPRGGIFDLDATERNRGIGTELDLTLSWPILSDLSATVEYGHFEPGDAYPTATNDPTRYLSVGVTSSF